ncbi:MAG: hypothetical protein LWW85_09970 [Marinilabiliales bacterium]|nr:hypothetical protein [Marinilabiliales bacterium]
MIKKQTSNRKIVLFLWLLLTATTIGAQEPAKAGQGKAQKEDYWQEKMVNISLPLQGRIPIVKLIQQGSTIHAVAKDQLFSFANGVWKQNQINGDWQTATLDTEGRLWLGCAGNIEQWPEGTRLSLPAEAQADTLHALLWVDHHTLLVGTSRGAWMYDGSWARVGAMGRFAVRSLQKGYGTELWAATSGGLFQMREGRWINLSYAVMSPGLGLDYRSLTSSKEGKEIYFGCQPAFGLISRDGNHALFSGDEGLPYGPAKVVKVYGNQIWIGTPMGAIRKSEEGWRYYAGKRWLTDNCVNDLLPLDENRVWVATNAGINQICRVRMTLDQKASLFEKRLNERHLHHGFAAECRFAAPGDTTNVSFSSNDNDGLWTSIYLAAESFRYAVTGAKEAYDNAVRTFLAMEKLNTVNPIPGFVARSYVSVEESTGEGGEWHLSSDGKWKWKGDTSSDEIVGHMFAYPLFYDLVAKGEMKERVKGLVDRLMTHIVDHNFELTDLDGLATRWAVWNPDSLNHSPRWMYEKGINSLQILAFLKGAAHVTGNPKYEKAYQFLAKEQHYLDNMLVQKMYGPYEINHSDDELSYLPYYVLLRYGQGSPDFPIYQKSLQRSWKVEEGDRIPIWNYIASIGLKKACGLEVARTEMQEIPLDIRNWQMVNSHRWDIRKSAIRDRFFKVQATKPIPTAERAVSKWNTNTFQMDAGGDGLSEDDGAYYLLPYWMARYHQLLKN